MRKTVSRRLFVLSPLALLISTLVSAAPVAPAARDAMKRDLGMTDAQVTQYFELEDIVERQGGQIAKAQGAGFAGSWFERNANGDFQFVVASTQPQKGAAGVTVRKANHSLAQLEAAKAELERIERGESTADRWQIEQRVLHAENQLTVAGRT